MKIQHYQHEHKTKDLSFAEWRDIVHTGEHSVWKVITYDELVRLYILENRQSKFLGIYEKDHALRMIEGTKSQVYVIDDEEKNDNELSYLLLEYINQNGNRSEFDSDELVCYTGIPHDKVKELLGELQSKGIVKRLHCKNFSIRNVFTFHTTEKTKQAFISGKYTKPEPKQPEQITKRVKTWCMNKWNAGVKLMPHIKFAGFLWTTGTGAVGYLTIDNWSIVKGLFMNLMTHFIP